MNSLEIRGYIYTAIALLVAIIPHEIAHGYAAYLLGDDTAKTDGRLSLNPLHHIDPVGLLSMIVFRIGWAKAVPINPSKFKGNRKVGTIIVSLAGVFVNFLQAFIFSIPFMYAYLKSYEVVYLFNEILWYNIMLGVFNLVPLPPLDGSKVIASLLPSKVEYIFYKYEKYFYFVLVLLVFSGGINKIIAPIILKIREIVLSFGAFVIWNIG
ncbi:site-2 protease family protein [Peptoniphilus stercorisuis]|uniref:Zn-dependent protease n=1 Tax=Peptoniphilus stercorisuis TaxID=1436965 RepID=A0ABS4KB41_9FIRM|nr:Zn-dependent protease [Peptoniphilus stercorisuis]